MKDFKDYYKELLRETSEKKQEPKTSFEDDIADAVKEHVKNSTATVYRDEKTDASTLDKAHLAAKYIRMQIEKPEDADKHKHSERIDYLKSILPDKIVNNLLNKHFPEHHK